MEVKRSSPLYQQYNLNRQPEWCHGLDGSKIERPERDWSNTEDPDRRQHIDDEDDVGDSFRCPFSSLSNQVLTADFLEWLDAARSRPIDSPLCIHHGPTTDRSRIAYRVSRAEIHPKLGVSINARAMARAYC